MAHGSTSTATADRAFAASRSRGERPALIVPGPPWAAITAIALTSACVSLAVSRLLFPHFSTNNDEAVYVEQARLLLAHRLTMPITPDTAFFRPWMSGEVDGHLVMVFPPVLPALLAAGQAVLGTMAVVPATIAAAAVLLAGRLSYALFTDRRGAVISAALLACCPLFVIQSGLFLTYVLALTLELAAAVLFVSGARRQRLRSFAWAGGVLGVLAFLRPLDALLVGAPLTAAAILVQRRRGWRDPFCRAGVILCGAAPALVASLAYDARVTGSPFRLPLHAIGGNNAIGFGNRQLSTGTPVVHYSATRALTATAHNLSAIGVWVPGGVVLMALAFIGLYRRRQDPWAWCLAAFGVTIPLGYVFYWGNLLVASGRRSIGPHYYLAVLAPLVVLSSVPLAELTRRRRTGGAVTLTMLVLSAGVLLVPKVQLNRHQVALHDQERALLDGAGLHDALVFLPAEPPDGAWLLHPRPSFMNDPDLRQSVLFAIDHRGDNVDLAERFPGRALYRLLARIPAEDPYRRYAPALWPLRTRSGDRVVLHQHIVNRGGEPVVTAYLSDGTHRLRYRLDAHSTLGRTYDVDWMVSAAGVALLPTGGAAVALSEDPRDPPLAGTLTVGAESGTTTDRPTSTLREVRYWYRVRADRVTLVLPAEPWQYEPGPSPVWRGQDGDSSLRVDVAT